MTITVYHYPNCSTCKKALKWLDARGIAHERIDIVERPPSAAVLRKVRAQVDGVRRLFNTSGQSYRSGGYKEKLASMSDAEAIAALAADGKLIKRPLVIGDDFVLVGFDEAQYASRLG